MTDQLKAKVFISCGQRKGTNEEDIANQLKAELEKMGYEAYVAIFDQNLNGFKENIFQNLRESEYFLFINFKRQKLLEEKPGETGEFIGYRGSLFSNQELAIASFREMPVIALHEEGVLETDGLNGFVQFNSRPFSDRKKVVEQVLDLLQKNKWSPNWKNQLAIDSMVTIRDSFDPGREKDKRIYSITVANNNPYIHAKNCHLFLEKVRNPSTGNTTIFKSIELKWRSYELPNATILPFSSRDVDAFSLDKDSPKVLGLNTHYKTKLEDYHPLIQIFELLRKFPELDITYLVVSDNFAPARATFKLKLADRIDQIVFEKIEPNAK